MNAIVHKMEGRPPEATFPEPPPTSPEHQMLAWLLNLVDPNWPDHYRVTLVIDQEQTRLSPTIRQIKDLVDSPSEQERFKALLMQMVKEIPHNQLSHMLAQLRKEES